MLTVCRNPLVFGEQMDVLRLLTPQQTSIARVDHLDLAQHLANDDLDVLVVDLHTLESIDVLNLLDQILGQGRDALETQDVVGRQFAVGDHLATLHALALEDVHMAPLGDQLFHRLAIVLGNDQALLTLSVLTEADGPRCLSEQGRFLRSARLE